MMAGIPLAEAARQLSVSACSLRRWVRQEGCPAIEGGPGRGKGYRVDLAAVRAWRESKTAAEGHAATLRELARLALDFWRRGCEAGELGQRLLGVSDAKAAALLGFLIDYFAVRLLKAELRTPETELLAAIAEQGLQNVYGVTDSVKGSELTTEKDPTC